MQDWRIRNVAIWLALGLVATLVFQALTCGR